MHTPCVRAKHRARGWSPGAWAATQKPTTLLVIRVLMVADAIVLGVVGGLYLAFASWPAALAVAGILFAVVLMLLALLPYTDPRRGSGSRW
ncbi:MAG: hypothetical protein ACXVZO_10645 [Gaiellaceae bacterium]